MDKRRYSNMGFLPQEPEQGTPKEFAALMSKCIMEVVIPVIEQRCLQISNEIFNSMNQKKLQKK